jgi:HEAT repeat protein
MAEHRAEVRTRIAAALDAADFPRSLEALGDIEPKKRLQPLFSALLGREALTRWHAVVALGATAAELAATRPETARDFWRNLMWRVNEESGTIGWGIPEVMGETLARAPALANDYHRILCSYVRDLPGDCTYIDHAPLRRGVWWALARLAEARPELASPALPDLAAALADPDPAARGLACLALARLTPPLEAAVRDRLETLANDETPFDLYRDHRLAEVTVAALAREALDRNA